MQDEQFAFFKTCNFLISQAVASLILESRQNSVPMPVDRAIVLHRAILINELYYGNNQVLVAKILNVFQGVKNEKVFHDYLLSVPDEAREFSKNVSALSFFELKEEAEKRRNNIAKIIENFLKQ